MITADPPKSEDKQIRLMLKESGQASRDAFKKAFKEIGGSVIRDNLNSRGRPRKDNS